MVKDNCYSMTYSEGKEDVLIVSGKRKYSEQILSKIEDIHVKSNNAT